MFQQEQSELITANDRQVENQPTFTEMVSRSRSASFRDLLAKLMLKYKFNQPSLACALEPDIKKQSAMQGTISQVLAGKRGVPLNKIEEWVKAMPVTAEEQAALYSLALREWAPDYVHDILDNLDLVRTSYRGVLTWLGKILTVDFFDYDSPDVQRRVEEFIGEVSNGRFPPAVIKQLRKGFIEMIIKSGITREDYKP